MSSLNDRRSGQRSSTTDIVSTAVLGILQLVASFILSGLGWLQLLSVASCSDKACDIGLLEFSGYLTCIVSAVALVGVLVFAILRGLRKSSTWWLPLVGLGVVICAYILSTTLNQLARS